MAVSLKGLAARMVRAADAPFPGAPCRAAALFNAVSRSRMRHLIAGLLSLALLASSAAAQTGKLDPLARRALHRLRSGASLEALDAAGVATGPARTLDVFITGTASRAALEAAGARVRTSAGGVATAYVPVEAIDAVANVPGVERIHGASRLSPSLNSSVATTGAPFLRSAGPWFTGWNGAGVVIGTVDTGLDVDHPDFQNASGGTRVIGLWDQTDAIGPNPSGYAYGSEWQPWEIDAGQCAQLDEVGHGTHVMGVAAGDGSGTGGGIPAHTYTGMAPLADLMVVKTDLSDTSVLDGVAWIMNRAVSLGKKAVVNLSVGSLFGPKDGTSPFEGGIDALTGAGRIVVVAAGNHGGAPVHSELTLGGGATLSTTMTVSGSAPGAAIGIDGYYESTGNLTLTVSTPSGTHHGPIALGGVNASFPGYPTTNGYLYFENGAVLTSTGDREVYIEINVQSGANANGTWTFTFHNAGAVASRDATTEDHTGAQWNAVSGTAATPGTSSGAAGAHLLISEVGLRGINSASLTDSTEFIEIMNPTPFAIDLSRVHLADVNAYAALPVTGSVNLGGVTTDFAVRFPAGATIAPGATKVIAVDGGRWKRATGLDADFMLFNAGGATSAVPMLDVSSNRGSPYPAFGTLDNAGEFLWLFTWDGASDLVCDTDLVYWGAGAGANAPARKLSTQCQDGPDAGGVASCYGNDLGSPTGSLGRPLAVPVAGAGTRQRDASEPSEAMPGNGCDQGSGAAVEVDLWRFYSNIPASFAIGNQPDQELIAEPGNARHAITVGAWVTKNRWLDCAGRDVGYTDTPQVGGLAAVSSPGPTRDGREKPDLAAPGLGIGSATSFDSPVVCPSGPSAFLNDAGMHTILEGTSFAAPHVAGAVALLLQKHGALTPQQVKNLLASRAITDGFTGTAWNRWWGHGKLFVGDLTDPTARVLSPNGGEVLTIGSPANLTWTASDAYLGVTAVDLEVQRVPNGAWEVVALAVPNTGSHAWNVTGPMCAQARLRVTARDAAGNAGVDVGDGTFTITMPLDVGEPEVTAFALALRSPQPARGAVEVEYALPLATRLTLDVFDLAGRRVATLASGPHAAGIHRARWEPASDAGAGVYFVRLRAPEWESAQRVVRTK